MGSFFVLFVCFFVRMPAPTPDSISDPRHLLGSADGVWDLHVFIGVGGCTVCA